MPKHIIPVKKGLDLPNPSKTQQENWGTRGLMSFAWTFIFLMTALLGFLGGIWYCYNFIR